MSRTLWNGRGIPAAGTYFAFRGEELYFIGLSKLARFVGQNTQGDITAYPVIDCTAPVARDRLASDIHLGLARRNVGATREESKAVAQDLHELGYRKVTPEDTSLLEGLCEKAPFEPGQAGANAKRDFRTLIERLK